MLLCCPHVLDVKPILCREQPFSLKSDKRNNGILTFSLFQCPHITLQLIYGLDVFIFLHAVKDDTTACLQICYTVLEDHCSDGNTDIHLIFGEIKSTNGTCVNTSSVIFELINQLDGFDFRGAGDSACRKD